MKTIFYPFSFLILITLLNLNCNQSQSSQTGTTTAINVEKKIIDENDKAFGYYLFVKPKTENIKGVLVLFPGFTQLSESIFTDSQLHEFAHKNDLLTIGFAGRPIKTADPLLQQKINAVLEDAIATFNLSRDQFVFGGFSSGGVIALRYVELCKQFPEQFPVNPKGVFMADSPIDMFHFWKLSEEILKNSTTEVAINEAKMVERMYRQFYGATPSENPEKYIELSPFSINKDYGTNEQYLKDVAVRAYHDIDIMWRLKNRNQTARYANYIATSELINRLLLMGNNRAEFIQTFQTGYRKNGKRHPHSWSIIDETECIEWIGSLLN